MLAMCESLLMIANDASIRLRAFRRPGRTRAPHLIQGRAGLFPTLNGPLIVVSPRIDANGAWTAISSPSTIRFEPSVAVEVAFRSCVPDSVWLARARSGEQALSPRTQKLCR